MSENTNVNTTARTAGAFKPGDKVRNKATGETGVVVDVKGGRKGTTPVIYYEETWGTVYDTPTFKLERIEDEPA